MANLKLKAMAFAMSGMLVLTPATANLNVYAEEVTNNGYDTTAPLVNSIIASAESFNAGEAATFSVNMTEEQTGIQEASFCIHPVGHSSVDDQIFGKVNVSGSASLTGTYDLSINLPENALNGQWVMDWYKVVDVQGNENVKGLNESEQVLFNVVSSNVDSDAPEVSSIAVKDTEVSVGDSVHFTVNATDASGISQITLGLIQKDHQSDFTATRYARLNVSDEDKNAESYELSYTIDDDDFAGQWGVTYVMITDTKGNMYTSSLDIDDYSFTVLGENMDTEYPVITNIDASDQTIIAPGVGNITISGTDSDSDSVSVSVNLINGDQEQFVRFDDIPVTDGAFTATSDVIFNKFAQAGDWTITWCQVEDSGKNKTNTEVSETEGNKVMHVENDLVINLHVGTSNPNLVQQINDMPEDGVALINVDNNILSADLFSAINGTNKTLIFDMDGIQWFFNGKDIDESNIKDIDISTDIETIDGTEYGYDSDVIALEFAANGELPGKADVRLKSDYITNLYDLDSSLYLAFIKSTADSDEELSTGDEDTDVEDDDVEDDMSDVDTREASMLSNGLFIADDSLVSEEDINNITDINADPVSLVKIENAGVTFDSESYVTISMTHNSSYILSNKLPKIKTVVPDDPTDNTSNTSDTTTVTEDTTGKNTGATTVTEDTSNTSDATTVTEDTTGKNTETVRSPKTGDNRLMVDLLASIIGIAMSLIVFANSKKKIR